MPFELPPLPYAHDALAPHISEETLRFHHDKHHNAYVTKLNGLVEGTDWADQSLEDLIKHSDGGLFNNAAQAWNHDFYWHCMAPNAGGEPTGALADAINEAFGSFATFQEQFTQAALGQFGSGWAWLVRNADGSLAIITTANADNPMRHDQHPLMTCDVWEHAYYIDTRNDRGQYVKNFWQVVNWAFIAEQWAAA